MPIYKARANISHDQEDYAPGDPIDLAEAQAAELVAWNAIDPEPIFQNTFHGLQDIQQGQKPQPEAPKGEVNHNNAEGLAGETGTDAVTSGAAEGTAEAGTGVDASTPATQSKRKPKANG